MAPAESSAWDGGERSAITVATSGGELVGMSLLAGNRKILEVDEGGSVTIEALQQVRGEA